MKKALILLLAAGLFALPALAQESLEDPTKTKTYAMPEQLSTIYIHPVSLIVFSAVDILPMYVYLTYERTLGPKNALILTPNYLSWKVSSGQDSFEASGYGVGLGIRHYLSKPVSGIYLQAKADLSYASVNVTSGLDKGSGSGLGAGILGYIGAKGKWDNICIFTDFGLGVGFSGVSAKAGSYTAEISSKGLIWEGDFGVGYSF